MLDTPSNPTDPVAEGASCTMRPDGCRAEQAVSGSGLLSGGCCPQNPGSAASHAPMGRAARLSSRCRPHVPRHRRGPVVAAATRERCAVAGIACPDMVRYLASRRRHEGYQGCPELGAIPSVMLGRPVGTSCELWRRIDRWVGSSEAEPAPCC